MIGIDLPCCTWSRARRAPRESRFPSALRSQVSLMGLPHLNARDRSTIALHNNLYRHSMRYAKGSIVAGKSGYIENPRSSLLWRTRGVKRLLKLGAYFLDLDMCQYGRQYKKSTRLLVWGDAWNNVSFKRCHGKHGICSRTGRKHICLSGLQDGRWRSSTAQIFSRQFGDAVASQVFYSEMPPATPATA